MQILEKPAYLLFFARMFPADADPGDMDAVLYGAGYPTAPRELMLPENAGKGPMSRQVLLSHPDGAADASLRPGALSFTPDDAAMGAFVPFTGGVTADAPAGALFLTNFPAPGFNPAALAAAFATQLPASMREGWVYDIIGDGVRYLSVPQRAALVRGLAACGIAGCACPADTVTQGAYRALGRGGAYKMFRPARFALYDAAVTVDISEESI